MSSITAEQIKELRERTGVGLGKCKAALVESGGDIEKAIEELRKAGVASAVKKESRATNEGRIEALETTDGIALVEMNAETDFVVNNERFGAFHKELVKDVAEAKYASAEEFLASTSKRDSSKTIDDERKELISVLGENIVISKVMFLPKQSNASYGIYSHMGGKIMCVVELSGATGEEAFAKEIGMHVAAEAPEYLAPEEVPAEIKAKEEEIAKSQVDAGKKPAEIVEKIIQGKVRSFFDQVCLLNQKYIKDNALSVAQFVSNHGKELGKDIKVTKFIRWQLGN